MAELAAHLPHDQKVVGSNLAGSKSDLTVSGNHIASFSHVIRKILKGEETRNREDGQITKNKSLNLPDLFHISSFKLEIILSASKIKTCDESVT